jgi:hypothetical protein
MLADCFTHTQSLRRDGLTEPLHLGLIGRMPLIDDDGESFISQKAQKRLQSWPCTMTANLT